MLKRTLAFITAVLLISGCAASSQESSSQAASDASSIEEQQYTPVYTYQNPDPDMVMISSPEGDITYRDYRLYLDVGEQMSRYTARQNLAVCHVLERDLKEMGIEIDESRFQEMADQQLMSMLLYSPSISQDMKDIAEATGMTDDEVNSAMKLSSRAQYLISLLDEEYRRIAAEEYVEPAEDKNAVEGETEEEAAQRREYEKQSAIYEAATQKLAEYSEDYNTRLSFDKDGVLATLDGEDIPLTDEAKLFIDYSAAASRLDAISFIQAGELSLREINRRGADFDTDAVMTAFQQEVSAMRQNEDYLKQLASFCEPFGATTDDYFKALERPILLQNAGDRLYEIVMNEYEELTAEQQDSSESSEPASSEASSQASSESSSEEQPSADNSIAASADEHYVNLMTELVAKSKIENLMGK